MTVNLPFTTEMVQQLILDSMAAGVSANDIIAGAQKLGIMPVLLAQSVQKLNPELYSGDVYTTMLAHIKKRYRANAAVSGFAGFTGEELTPEQIAKLDAERAVVNARIFGPTAGAE